MRHRRPADPATLRSWLLGIVLSAAVLAGCAPSEEEFDFLARQALLRRQNQGLRELIQEEERGSLVPSGRFLVGIDESIVGDFFRSQLPVERPLGKRFVIRLESATVSLRDKFGVVTIEGNVHRAATPERKTALRAFGGLDSVAVDSSGKLRVKIAIDHIDILEAGMLEGILGRSGKKLLAEQGRPMVQQAIPRMEIPVALARSIRVPSFEAGGVQLAALDVPLDLSVERVIAADGRLWVTLNAGVGKVTGAEQGLGVAVRKKPRSGGSR